MRDTNHRDQAIYSTEFEATGVESDSASPQGRNRLGYEAFVPAFEEACGYRTSGKKAEHILFAKYFQGMIDLGIAKSDPPWNKIRDFDTMCPGSAKRRKMMIITRTIWSNSSSKSKADSTVRYMQEGLSNQS